jgi:hypothetical protein
MEIQECPPVLRAEAERLWTVAIQTLRESGTVEPRMFLYRLERNERLTGLGRLESGFLPYALKIAYAQWVRQRVRETGANVVIAVSDVWSSALPQYAPEVAPDRREALCLYVEVQDGRGWGCVHKYARIGKSIFISDEMDFECSSTPGNSGGRLQNLWSPTPVPSNN